MIEITDEMCRLAHEAIMPDRIQGFSTPNADRTKWGAPHYILDVWRKPGEQEIWRGDTYEEMAERCEIERMRIALRATLEAKDAEIEQLRAALDDTGYPLGEIDALRAEIAELRTRLSDALTALGRTAASFGAEIAKLRAAIAEWCRARGVLNLTKINTTECTEAFNALARAEYTLQKTVDEQRIPQGE